MSDNTWDDIGGFVALLTAALFVCKIAGGNIEWRACIMPLVVYVICTCVMVCVIITAGYFYSKTKGRKDDDDRAGG